jgi:hypothetical protein
MKKIAFLLFVICIAFSSCGKKQESVENKPGIFCEVDGRSWTGDTISYIMKQSNEFDIVAVYGKLGTGTFESFPIYIRSELKVGDFIITKETAENCATFTSTLTKKDKKSETDEDVFMSTDGKLTVTKFDESSVTGTFNINFISRDQPYKNLKITNGKFNLKIIK